MAIIKVNPTTSGRRGMSFTDYSVLTRKKPEKSLTRILKKNSGRDITGQISVRHQGGGSKRMYRIITSLSANLGKKAKVESLEYDPNRSAFITLISYEDGVKAYILAWEGIKVGDTVTSAEKAEVNLGNRMRLKNIPAGTGIFDIEIQPGQGGKLVKSAGGQGFIVAKDSPHIHLKMASGEVRRINENCFASIGQVSNNTNSFVKIGKAGRNRWKGIRPSVRGKVMDPSSHPHGGGEGNNPIGLKYPKTPWGKIAIGGKTRKKKKYSDKMIIKRRK